MPRRRWCASTWTRWGCSISARTSCRSTRCCSIPGWSASRCRAPWRCARPGRRSASSCWRSAGFHPRFTPPPGFPALQRITIDMPSGIVSKLRLAAYLALTSNSIQLGANLDVFIGVSGFGLSGHLGFDALLQRHPFRFDADISGSVALTAGGDDLASVSLDATLTGPAPYNIAGKFKVHIVFFDVHVSFNHSWGEDAPSLPVASVDVARCLGRRWRSATAGTRCCRTGCRRWCRCGRSRTRGICWRIRWRGRRCTSASCRWGWRSRASGRRCRARARSSRSRTCTSAAAGRSRTRRSRMTLRRRSSSS